MDKTLRSYLLLADQTQEFVYKFGAGLTPDQLKNKVITLQKSIKTLQAISKRLADVSNNINQLILYKKKKSSNISKYINPYPTENDHAVLRTLYPTECKSILPSINIPVCYVNNPIDIPIGHIYYIKSLKQYAINIFGIIIKGNLANIVKYQTKNSARCDYGIYCKSLIKNKECKYYHDPEDYVQLQIEVPEVTRNYTIGSWIYSSNRNPKNYYMRHVGSKNTLIYDLEMLKTIQYREEIANREGQLIHDLLIYLILHQQGLLERYKHW